MFQPPYVLVIDQGGHSTRALVVDARLQVVTEAHCGIRTLLPQPGWVEHDPAELVSSLHTVLSAVATELGDAVSLVTRAGLACQRSSIICWDAVSGEALSPCLSWQDRRGQNQLKVLQVHASEIQRRTGLQLSPHYGASKLRWCLDCLPAVQAAASQQRLCLGPQVAWLVAQLTAQPRCPVDAVNAARTQLFNLETLAWDPWLLELFGIQEALLPAIEHNDAQYGMLNLGGNQIPLGYVTGDQAAALWAQAKPRVDILYINIGSGAFLQRITEQRLSPAEGLLNSLVEVTGHGGRFSLEATINGAANALDWLAGQEQLEDLVKHLPNWLQRETDAIFINAVGGLAAPWWRSDIVSHFVDDSDTVSRAIAVIESVVFLIVENMQRMSDALASPRQILVSGGLSRLDGLCRRLADLAQLPVHRLRAAEATAFGIARCLLPEIAVEPAEDIFMPGSNKGLHQRYRHWRDAMTEVLQES